MNPCDLSISLRAVRNPQHVLNGGPEGATFPGWFLTVQQEEGYSLVTMQQISFDDVAMVANLLDSQATGTHEILNAAKACDKAMRDELLRQLEVAEKQAARIPELRRRLGVES